ncbi:MAG: MAPEG family protein, partial [Gammaproteobacteria bacterium]
MTPTLAALTGFVAWSLFLLVVMELLRTRLVLTGAVPANGFTPDNAGLSPFMQRLARAHANCVEGLPIFGGLMLIAVVNGWSTVT